MNSVAERIRWRMSLRNPQIDALEIFNNITDALSLSKDFDLADELLKVKTQYQACTDFERAFPSVCFSIATGVGKTRLMAAFMAYLYLKKGMKNFFVLAPNLTIYNKLIEDFGNPTHPKYTFHGFNEFVSNRPMVITGENYTNYGGRRLDDAMTINVFNIAKFNSDNRGGKKAPKMKRLSEYLGESYFEYLANLPDLVVLMDEAHRYHADASKNAINELRPVLGVEMTATPMDEKGKMFKNVVYEYSLAKALDDGLYIKNPTIATRKNFTKEGKTEDEIERIKLEDAISVHEDTKTQLELYAREYDKKRVKPFVMVVCKDTTHAKAVCDYIRTESFFKSEYKNKVLQIDSTTKNEDDVAGQFLTVEQYENPIEIVIHVNMLKEGWDVSNLYTIVPLRAANASILIEQTIGRGLRLPFGVRTGVSQVDKLTVIAHDNFQRVIEEANKSDSILRKMSFIEFSNDDLNTKTVPITSASVLQTIVEEEKKSAQNITDERAKTKAINTADAKIAIINALPDFNIDSEVKTTADLSKESVKEKVLSKVATNLSMEFNILAPLVVQEAKEIYDSVIKQFRAKSIDIPRMVLAQGETKAWFDDFDLDTSKGFNLLALNEDIMRVSLDDTKDIDFIGVRHGAIDKQPPQNQLASEMMNIPRIDYDRDKILLMKLIFQALDALRNSCGDDKELAVIVRQHRRLIAHKIYEQMDTRFNLQESGYDKPRVLPFTKIEPWNFAVISENGYRDYRDIVADGEVRKYVFRGFEKACHFEYKFDSSTEKSFAYILELDANVQKWLRPAPAQFRIYWNKNSNLYQPDFIVETENIIYMAETKKAKDIDSAEVEKKAKAALTYCKHATAHNLANGGKEWKYLLIPHDKVSITTSFEKLINYHLLES
ncbi:MAG: hypothetical protein RL154_388 [Pseudomonadota bacterium]|jgi:type III restriction enzyme